MPPETPEIGLGALLFRGRGNRHDAVLARVQGRRDPADGPALARRVVAFEHRHQGVLAHALVPQQAGQARLFGNQLFFVVVLVQVLGHVQAVQQAELIHRRRQRRRVDLGGSQGLAVQRALQPFQENPPHGKAAVMRVDALDHVPGRIVAAGAAQHALAVLDELVVGF